MESGERPAGDEYRVLVVGKTGNGKSSVCNAILGREEFKTGRSMASTTLAVQQATVHKGGKDVKVVDAPDVSNMEDMRTEQIQKEISGWQNLTSPSPTAILLAIRCDVRYTQEEYELYRQIKFFWGDNNFCRRLVVVFTFGDRQDRPIDQELKTVCPELKGVLKDAGNRYVIFDKTRDGNEARFWNAVQGHIQEMDREQLRPEGRDRELDGRDWERRRAILLLFLVLLVVLLFGGVLAFILLQIPAAAIGVAVVGIVLVAGLAFVVYTKWGTRRIV